MPILKNDNLLDNFESYIDMESAIKELGIEKNDIDWVGNSLNTKSYVKNMLSRCTF